MYIAGLDLAAKPDNPSGLAIFYYNTLTNIELIKSNDEVIERLLSKQFSIIAVDAPIVDQVGFSRECDKLMKKYGAMPLSLYGIQLLAERAKFLLTDLNDRLKKSELINSLEIIEVFPTGSAKILKIYNKDLDDYWDSLINIIDRVGIKIDKKISVPKTKHEIDAVVAAFTGWLSIHGLTTEVGDDKGTITIPDINKIEESILIE